MATIRISNAGINRIKEHEALRLKAYKDAVGKWTIGYGHLILPHEQALIGTTLTDGEAESLLRSDLAKAETTVNRLVKTALTGNQYDAIVSLVFNIGVGNFERSTMLVKINNGDYEGAAAEFPRWVYAEGKQLPGLIARRAKEQSLFLT